MQQIAFPLFVAFHGRVHNVPPGNGKSDAPEMLLKQNWRQEESWRRREAFCLYSAHTVARLCCSLALGCIRINAAGNVFPGPLQSRTAVLQERHIRLSSSFVRLFTMAGNEIKAAGKEVLENQATNHIFELNATSLSCPWGQLRLKFNQWWHWCDKQRDIGHKSAWLQSQSCALQTEVQL